AGVLHRPAGGILHHVACVRRLCADSRGEGSSRRTRRKAAVPRAVIRDAQLMQQMLSLDFMRNAFLTGGCITLAAGLVGYFVVLRNQVFTTDALGHVAFTGSLGGLLVGLNLLVGVFSSCIAVALAIGTLGGRGRGRDVAIGTVFAWVLGVGVLFLSLYTASRSAASGTVGVTVLFGSILGLQSAQVIIGSVTGIATCVAL